MNGKMIFRKGYNKMKTILLVVNIHKIDNIVRLNLQDNNRDKLLNNNLLNHKE